MGRGLSVIVLLSALLAGAPSARATTVINDVFYRHTSTANLYLDVYKPDGPGPFPSILLIHGSWCCGDKSDFMELATDLANTGFTVFVPDFRLDCDPAHRPRKVPPGLCGYLFPDGYSDLEAAMRWVRTNAALYGGIPSQVGTLGGSGGAISAMLLGTSETGAARPDAAVGWSGGTDLTAYPLSPQPGDYSRLITETMGCPYTGSGSCPALWQQYSPIDHASPTSAPTYMAIGKGDEHPFSTDISLAADLNAAGIPSYADTPDTNIHGRILGPVVVAGCCETVLDASVAFFQTFFSASPAADLILSGVPDYDPVAAGASLTYSFTVTNAGPQWATGTTFTDDIPAGATLVLATAGQGACQGSTTVTCQLGALSPSRAVPVTIVVTTPVSATSLPSTASVSAAQRDPSPSDDSLSFDTGVVPAASTDVGIKGAAAPSPVVAGDELVYTLTARNGGASAARGVRVTADLPTDAALVSATPSQGTCGGTAVVVCHLGTLHRGKGAIVAVAVVLHVPNMEVLTAHAMANVVDSNNLNNSSSTSVEVTAAPNITYVQVLKNGFSPKKASIPQGTQVQWNVPSDTLWCDHVRSTTRVFDSGCLPAGSYFSYTFIDAGQYSVNEQSTDHNGTLTVPVQVVPTKGTVDSVFTVTWGSAPPAAGDSEDIQIQRPGSSTWTNWLMGQASTSAPFTPDSGPGTYSFRARLDTGKLATPWSPGTSITVNS